jgi:hypothetical protein
MYGLAQASAGSAGALVLTGSAVGATFVGFKSIAGVGGWVSAAAGLQADRIRIRTTINGNILFAFMLLSPQ